jgi:hypothetical protein
VLDLDHPTNLPWDGSPIAVTLSGALDPRTAAMGLVEIRTDSSEVDLPMAFRLEQGYDCVGGLTTRLIVEIVQGLPAAGVVRLEIPGVVRGISGAPEAENRVEGGLGWQVNLLTR